ncbi:tyrosine-type recombinase/integrase [Cryptosporangium phraense]|uniref:Site-specific integrase n=1 Tax=Cryptosporangium phraense TaxID=2593070 RepID=A0A545AN67_9ACTN|nr:site-specific integrase [Cryptosporangium phraense]TQS42777.1 site-specific integrase [Cryptosporangium phraense]
MACQGVVFKACACSDGTRQVRRNRTCSRLSERGHGSWHLDCRVPDLAGGTRQVRRGGFRSAVAARAARAELLGQSPQRHAAATWTLAQWLRYWLTTRTSIRPTTRRSYTEHCEQYLIPELGQVRLDRLALDQLRAAFTQLGTRTNRYGNPIAAATLHRIRATLRASLNAAVREGLLTDNPARRLELPPARRPHAVVWTAPQVQAWERDGTREPVAVWTVEQLVVFLARAERDRLHALWHLTALRGLRRGEAAGLRWCDLDLTGRVLHIAQQRTEVPGQVLVGPPKSRASRRTVALDRHTVRVLRAHADRQRFERRAAGAEWTDTGYVFTRRDGQPLSPSYLTHRFAQLVADTGLPPVRLHDLRHGAASLAHAAGADLKTVQDQLGHASIVLTADTYTSVLPPAQHSAAAATAALVLAAARRARGVIQHRNQRRRIREMIRTIGALQTTNQQLNPLDPHGKSSSHRRATGKPPLSA